MRFDSGIMPSKGIDNISSISSTLNISPLFTLLYSYLVISKCFFISLLFSDFKVQLFNMPIILSESLTDDISGFVTTIASSAKYKDIKAPFSIMNFLS